jgi:hypothetical protein
LFITDLGSASMGSSVAGVRTPWLVDGGRQPSFVRASRVVAGRLRLMLEQPQGRVGDRAGIGFTPNQPESLM